MLKQIATNPHTGGGVIPKHPPSTHHRAAKARQQAEQGLTLGGIDVQTLQIGLHSLGNGLFSVRRGRTLSIRDLWGDAKSGRPANGCEIGVQKEIISSHRDTSSLHAKSSVLCRNTCKMGVSSVNSVALHKAMGDHGLVEPMTNSFRPRSI